MKILPKGWKLKTLEDLCYTITDGTHKTPSYVEEGIPFITTSNLNLHMKCFDFSNYKKFISLEEHKELTKRCRPEKGDLLISKCGTIGRTKAIDVEYEFSVFVGLALLKLKKEEVSAKYLEKLLNWEKMRLELERVSPGSSRKTLTIKSIKNFLVPIPPLNVQERMVKILEQAEQLKKWRQESFKLTDDYLNSIFFEMFGEVTKFAFLRLEDIADDKKYSLSSGPFGSNLTSKHYVAEGVPVLRGMNISKGELSLDDVKFISEEKARALIRSEIRPGDVVVVAVGSSGKALTIPQELPRAIMSQNFNKITPNLVKINPVYLEYCINSPSIQAQLKKRITDTVRTFLSLTKLKSVKIPVPPITLQNKFATIVQQIKQLKDHQKQSKKQIENLFNVLMQKAFRGELVC